MTISDDLLRDHETKRRRVHAALAELIEACRDHERTEKRCREAGIGLWYPCAGCGRETDIRISSHGLLMQLAVDTRAEITSGNIEEMLAETLAPWSRTRAEQLELAGHCWSSECPCGYPSPGADIDAERHRK